MIVIYPARQVLTLDPSNPTATCVATQDGRFLHVGSYADVINWLRPVEYRVDDRFSDAVLTPGFIEAHGHVSGDGALSTRPWLGFDERRRPDGSVAPGCRTLDDVIATLKDFSRTFTGTTLVGVGFDPVFFERALTRHDLDAVSKDLEVVVMNASGHLAYVNSYALHAHGVDRTTTEPGVLFDGSGEPTGELHERAMGLVLDYSAFLGDPAKDALAGLEMARLAGVTTVSDLACVALGERFEAFRATITAASTPARVAYSPLVEVMGGLLGKGLVTYLHEQRRRDSDVFFMGPCKLITDGSIQGFTAAVGWPGYCSGSNDHAQLLLNDDAITQHLQPLHDEGFSVAMHTNGDEATEHALRAIERVLLQRPRIQHGHRLEHVQMATSSQLAKAAKLGVGLNFFINHVYYWGDVHRTEDDWARPRPPNGSARECRCGQHRRSDPLRPSR
jgi:predicted amidohydrolase YtcJ